MDEIFLIERGEIFRVQNVAGTHLTVFVFHDGVDSDGIILHEFITHGQQIELLDAVCGFADAVIHQHVEFQLPLFRDADQVGHIQRFEKRDHGVGRLHPELVCGGARCAFGIIFILD